ncbi:MAG: hypothetical protein K8R54_00095 [Bacteroidales bacterium]|nr:hypothetical protein [Bacteroidales bacterium]
MRKPKIVLVLLLGIFVVFQSCEKKELLDTANEIADIDNIVTDAENTSFDAVKRNYDGKSYYFTGESDIYNLLRNPFDKEDENMFYQVYKIAKNFKNSKPCKLLNEYIYNEAKNSKSQSVKYEKVIDFDKNYDVITDNNFKSDYNDISSLMIYNNSNYLVEIYIPNIETADLTMKPIIAIGTDLYTNNDDLNDYIPAWYINNDNSFDEILINEKDAYSSEKPVLIFSIYCKNKLTEANDNIETPNLQDDKSSAKGGVNINSILLKDCKIKYRYERDNKSEFAFGFKIRNGNYRSKTLINDKFIKIHKTDLNKDITVNKRLHISTTYIADRVYGVTYERDWYVSDNNSHSIYIGGSQDWTILCKMKYSNEWYQKVDYLNLPDNSSGDVYFTSKGYVKFSWPY